MEISPTLKINQEIQRRRREGLKTINFGFGQSPFPVPYRMVEKLKEYAFCKDYLPTAGLDLLRTSISNYYLRRFKVKSNKSNVIVGPGSKELLFLTQLISKKELILQAPSWVSYVPQAKLAGLNYHYIECHAEENFKLSPSHLDSFLQKKNLEGKGLFILNAPNNPTGLSYHKDELASLAEVFKKYDILVVSDEIYAEFQFDNDYTSIAEFYPDKTIVCSGLSKWCGAGGWRLGYMIFPDQLFELKPKILSAASETYSCVSAPVQYAAIEAFVGYGDIDNYTNICRNILKTCWSNISRTLNADKIQFSNSAGGFYSFMEFKGYTNKDIPSDEFFIQLLNKTGIALLPGSAFGISPQKITARMAFVELDLNEDDMKLIAQGKYKAKDNNIYNSAINSCIKINDYIY